MVSRLASLGLLIAVVIAIPLSHSAVSKKNEGPRPKVPICHFPDDSTEGHVIVVSEAAVAAHLDKHGDCTAFVAGETERGCRCLTCEETCEADAVTCRAECPAEDTQCLAACETGLSTCLAACEPEAP